MVEAIVTIRFVLLPGAASSASVKTEAAKGWCPLAAFVTDTVSHTRQIIVAVRGSRPLDSGWVFV